MSLDDVAPTAALMSHGCECDEKNLHLDNNGSECTAQYGPYQKQPAVSVQLSPAIGLTVSRR